MRDRQFADRPSALPFGCLKPGATVNDIDAFVTLHGLVCFGLGRPSRDASCLALRRSSRL